jgi:hypothetical protein
MIVKYLEDGAWNYIDHVFKAENSAILPLELIKQFEEETTVDGKLVSNPDKGIDMSNKAFSKAIEAQLGKEWGNGVAAHNLLDPTLIKNEYPAVIIKIHTEDDNGEYKFTGDTVSVVLVTNQTAYLMNDKGQTIERLV